MYACSDDRSDTFSIDWWTNNSASYTWSKNPRSKTSDMFEAVFMTSLNLSVLKDGLRIIIIALLNIGKFLRVFKLFVFLYCVNPRSNLKEYSDFNQLRYGIRDCWPWQWTNLFLLNTFHHFQTENCDFKGLLYSVQWLDDEEVWVISKYGTLP